MACIHVVYFKQINEYSKTLFDFIHFDKTIALCRCAYEHVYDDEHVNLSMLSFLSTNIKSNELIK